MRARTRLLVASLLFACQASPPEAVERRASPAPRAKVTASKVELAEQQAQHLLARRTPDGRLEVSCVKGREAARAAVEAAAEQGRR